MARLFSVRCAATVPSGCQSALRESEAVRIMAQPRRRNRDFDSTSRPAQLTNLRGWSPGEGLHSQSSPPSYLSPSCRPSRKRRWRTSAQPVPPSTSQYSPRGMSSAPSLRAVTGNGLVNKASSQFPLLPHNPPVRPWARLAFQPVISLRGYRPGVAFSDVAAAVVP